ncbi:MAG: archaellin/type IV pilin N-terminal domain-containing protein [Nanoarchaeota archaeon]
MTFLGDNRGVSQIVTTVLLLFIVVALVSIVFVFVLNYSAPLSLSPQSCIDMQNNPPITVNSACYNSASDNVELMLSRGVDDYSISSLKSSIIYDSHSSSWSCDPACSSCVILPTGLTKYYYIYSSDKPNSLELVINDCSTVLVKSIRDC